MSDPNATPLRWRVLATAVILGAAGVAVWWVAPVPLVEMLRPWYLSRSSGLVAYVLLWLSICLGLLQSAGLLRGLTAAMNNIELHDHASLLSLYATLFHAGILVYDHYISLGLTDILIPFATPYKTIPLALGILGLWVTVFTILSTYLRQTLSTKAWRVLHQLSLVGFGLALAHGVLAGSDTKVPALVFLYMCTGISTVALTVYRVAQVATKKAVRAAER